MTETKPSFEMSIDTRIIYNRLNEAAVGEVVSFKALGDALGRKVEGNCSHIQSALNRLLGEGVLFDNVRKVGYKRLTDSEIVNTSEREREGLKRKARRAVKKLSCVSDFDALPNELKVKHNASMSGFGAIMAMMKPSGMRKLETAVQKASQQLPLAKTLEAFRD